MTDSAEPRGSRRTRYVRARTRIGAVGLGGIAAYALAAALTPWQVAVLLGWDVMAASYVGWVFLAVRGADAEETARIAKIEDPSRALSHLVLVSASVVSLAGVAFALVKASTATGTAEAMITSVAVLTVAISWVAVHTVFALRYADLYYLTGGGIDFHDGRAPDYGDFGYVAFTIGMTYQVSDTDLVSRPIRRAALRHALLSYLFGIAVIATTINVVAGLVNHH